MPPWWAMYAASAINRTWSNFQFWPHALACAAPQAILPSLMVSRTNSAIMAFCRCDRPSYPTNL